MMMEILYRYDVSISRNDKNNLITVAFSYGDWTHRDTMTAIFRAFVYHALAYSYRKEPKDVFQIPIELTDTLKQGRTRRLS